MDQFKIEHMGKYIGVMSGTSVDGIDAVLVSIQNREIYVIDSISKKFPDKLASDIKELLSKGETSLQKLGEIDHRLGLAYADCVNSLLSNAGVGNDEIVAIGCHGQTIFHAPGTKYPFTMQIGDGNLLAAKTGITTITDFRRMDMAFGGEGAPLTPAFHKEFFGTPSEKRVILNLGGIANITILEKGRVFGMDTGPANCLLDLWIQASLGKKFDEDGNWAKSGQINDDLLKEFLKEEYFNLEPPKSTGKELYNLDWIRQKMNTFSDMPSRDVQATLTELTARTVAGAIVKYAPGTQAVYVCGGGAFNKFLLERLAYYLPDISISTTSKLGMPEQLVEAVAFAWLAYQRMKENAGNLPEVTGAKEKVVLGNIYKCQ